MQDYLPPLPEDELEEWSHKDDIGVDGYAVETMVFDPRSKAPPQQREELYGDKVRDSDNLAKMKELSETGIMRALAGRYRENVMYTYIGDIIVAVNPYKDLGIFTPAFQSIFMPTHAVLNPIPHVYGVAQSCFKELLHSEQSQCCVISGESGAGKTETAKYFVSHLLALASKHVASPVRLVIRGPCVLCGMSRDLEVTQPI